MTVTEIQKEINKFREQIVSSRRNIADGCFVNITALKSKSTALFGMISEKLHAEFDGQFEKLLISVSTLIHELDKLEEDLKIQHDSFISSNQKYPNAVIAAYQN